MAHALLSASASHRWLKCPPSARLEALFPKVTSESAEEGTVAHEYGEKLLKNNLFTSQGNLFDYESVKQSKYYNDEMERHCQGYLTFVLQKAEEVNFLKETIEIEKRVSFSNFVPQGFGTCDCLALSKNTLHIIDLKYGKNVQVDATYNPQLMLYALGALNELDCIYDPKNIELNIYQPRMDNISSFTLSKKELAEWAQEIKPAVKQAWEAQGDMNPSKETCRFCKAKGACKAYKNFCTDIKQYINENINLMTYAKIAEVLNSADRYEGFIKAVRERAAAELMDGNSIPGYKLVESNKHKKFTSEEAVNSLLENPDFLAKNIKFDFYERRLKTPAVFEKALGKEIIKEFFGDLIIKPQGDPSLAKADDKRKEWIREEQKQIEAKSAFDDDFEF